MTRGEMFHYALLKSPAYKAAQWSGEYANNPQSVKLRWLNEIYMQYDLLDEEVWVAKNKLLSGFESPYPSSCHKTNGGKLFVYHGEHPDLIEASGLPMIKDFRRVNV